MQVYNKLTRSVFSFSQPSSTKKSALSATVSMVTSSGERNFSSWSSVDQLWQVYIVIFVISEDPVKIYTPKTLFDWTIIIESERLPLPPLVITLYDCFRLRPLFIPEHKRLFPWTRFSTRDRHRALAWQHGHRGEKHPHTTSFLHRLCSLEPFL